jgi:TonB-dependent SusC/RagA subfamily outer membrane receptor
MKPLKKVGATNTINVSMQSGESLSEVVVQTNFGYFLKIQGCYLLPFLFRQTKLRQSPALTIQNALQGQAAGVQVTGSNGKPGSSFRYSSWISITGGSAQAIYVVDGAFVDGSEASALSSNDIESVSVLKDGASAAIYGVRGGNGVIVTTKKGKNAKLNFI